jgi:hypothetical protein
MAVTRTIDREIAAGLPAACSGEVSAPVIASSLVPKRAVYGVCIHRGEFDVIVDPQYLYDIDFRRRLTAMTQLELTHGSWISSTPASASRLPNGKTVTRSDSITERYLGLDAHNLGLAFAAEGPLAAKIRRGVIAGG